MMLRQPLGSDGSHSAHGAVDSAFSKRSPKSSRQACPQVVERQMTGLTVWGAGVYPKHCMESNSELPLSFFFMSERNFRQLEHDLDQAVTRLKGTKDPKLRRDLLGEMRLLLTEADRLLLGEPESLRSLEDRNTRIRADV
jgi:hypothetical protein